MRLLPRRVRCVQAASALEKEVAIPGRLGRAEPPACGWRGFFARCAKLWLSILRGGTLARCAKQGPVARRAWQAPVARCAWQEPVARRAGQESDQDTGAAWEFNDAEEKGEKPIEAAPKGERCSCR